ncbi:7828_t:CDS:2, partial [Dentiscutata heterogama]
QNNPDSIQAEIRDLLATPISLQAVGFGKNMISNISSQSSTSNMSTHTSLSSSYHEYNIRSNSAAQKAAYEKIQIAKKKCGKYFPTLKFIQNHKKSQHGSCRYQNSNSATFEFVQSHQLHEEIGFEHSLSDSEPFF